MSEVAGRVLDLLERVVVAEQPLGLMELAAATGLDKTTASRMLRFLVGRELVVRDPATQRYRVGPAFVMLSAAALGRSDIRIAAEPYLVALRDAAGETVGLHFRAGLDRVCIYGVESAQDVRTAITSGERRPLYAGASGKAMLAFLPPEELEAALQAAEKAGGDRTRLMAEIAAIRDAVGVYALSDRIAGLSAVSVPLFGAGGVAGSLTISGPAQRWTMERMRGFLPELRSAARQISHTLGGAMPAHRGA